MMDGSMPDQLTLVSLVLRLLLSEIHLFLPTYNKYPSRDYYNPLVSSVTVYLVHFFVLKIVCSDLTRGTPLCHA